MAIHHSKFSDGDIVHRKDRADGSPPPYRFRGVVCGSYFNGSISGAVVNCIAEQGCIQIFPDYMLELCE